MKNLFLKAVLDRNINEVKTYLNDTSFQSEWMYALNLDSIIKESSEIGILLIEKGIDINIRKPLLAYAIDNKLDNVVDALLARADLNVNKIFNTPANLPTSLLIYAINHQANKVVKALLANDAIDLNLRPNYGGPHDGPLEIAIKGKNIELVNDILNHKNFKVDLLKNVSLNNVIKDSPEIATLLIEKGINIDERIIEQNGLYNPLLAYAIKNKLDNVVDALLARPDIQIGGNYDFVIDYISKQHNIGPFEHLVKQLIIASVQVNGIIDNLKQINFDLGIKFSDNKTVLHVLLEDDANSDKTFKFIDYLLQQNTPLNEPVINVNQRDNNGNRAIDLVKNNITNPFIKNNYTVFIKLLRDYGSVEPK